MPFLSYNYLIVIFCMKLIFFLYFVLVSGYCAELLNCGLQRYMDRNIFFRHLLLFLSIYIFTFVLNWYTFASLQIQPLSSDKKEKEKEKEKPETTIDFMTNANNLIKWLGYSVFIYVIFLISTKYIELCSLTQRVPSPNLHLNFQSTFGSVVLILFIDFKFLDKIKTRCNSNSRTI